MARKHLYEPGCCARCGAARLVHQTPLGREYFVRCAACGYQAFVPVVFTTSDPSHPILDAYFADLDAAGALLWLQNFFRTVWCDDPLPDNGIPIWFDQDRIRSLVSSAEAVALREQLAPVEGPVVVEDTKTCTAPLLLYLDELDDDDMAEFKQGAIDIETLIQRTVPMFPDETFLPRVATCEHCRHRWIPDEDDIFGGSMVYCLRPLTKDEFFGDPNDRENIERGFYYPCAEPGFNQSVAEHSMWWLHHALWDIVLRSLPLVEEAHHEGFVETLGQFVGPLCPGFEIDPEHIDLVSDVYAFAMQDNWTITFGLRNFERERRVARQAALRSLKQEVEERLRQLRADPSHGRILRTRIDKRRWNTSASDTVIECAAQALLGLTNDKAMLGEALLNQHWLFDVSNSVWPLLIGRIVRRVSEKQETAQ